MRIAFVVIGNSRRSNYLNGYNLRYGGGGGSGTDTSAVLVAEYLAKQGHEVVIATDKLEPLLEGKYKLMGRIHTPGEISYGVQYTDIEFNGIQNKEFDILVSMLWFQEYDKLPIKITKSLIYWSHMQWAYGIGNFIKYSKDNNLSIGLVHISNWEMEMNKTVFHHINTTHPNSKMIIIPNPIFDELIDEVKKKSLCKKLNKFIFHASWARGGNVAIDALRNIELPNKELHAFDYLITIHDHKDKFFIRHDGVDKMTLFTHLSESDYFLYPLYTPYQDVHKDTFSCVVAEALALGVIVITYPLGALPENFGDYCVWIDPPEGADIIKMQTEPLSKDIEGIFKNNIQNIIDKINYLNNNPQIKEEIRYKGSSKMIENFNINKIGHMWENFINNL